MDMDTPPEDVTAWDVDSYSEVMAWWHIKMEIWAGLFGGPTNVFYGGLGQGAALALGSVLSVPDETFTPGALYLANGFAYPDLPYFFANWASVDSSDLPITWYEGALDDVWTETTAVDQYEELIESYGYMNIVAQLVDDAGHEIDCDVIQSFLDDVDSIMDIKRASDDEGADKSGSAKDDSSSDETSGKDTTEGETAGAKETSGKETEGTAKTVDAASDDSSTSDDTTSDADSGEAESSATSDGADTTGTAESDGGAKDAASSTSKKDQ